MQLQKTDNGVPVLAFAGWSGSGKTTLIERLIPLLRENGLRLAVIKHDAHGIDVDQEGKDSWRFSKAGAEIVAVSSMEKTAWIEQRELNIGNVLDMVHDVDLVLPEGEQRRGLIAFRENGICDRKLPVYSPENIEEIAEYIMRNMDDFTHFNAQGRAKMVDIGVKSDTKRTAVAAATVLVSRETFRLIQSGG